MMNPCAEHDELMSAGLEVSQVDDRRSDLDETTNLRHVFERKHPRSLDKHHVSWKYYVDPQTPFIWNTLPYSTDVHQDGQTGNIQSISHFYADVRAGKLPQRERRLLPRWHPESDQTGYRMTGSP